MIGDLVVRLNLDNDKFDRGITRSQSKMQRAGKLIGGALAGIGIAATAMAAATAGAFASMVRDSFTTLDSLGKMSDRLGITVDKLQGLRHAADLSGISLSELEKSMQRLTVNTSDAAMGLGESQQAFRDLGIDAAKLNQLSPDQKLLAIADALQGIENQADRVQLADSLFGGRGVGLLQLLDDGAAGIQAMVVEGDRLNGSLTRMDVAKIEEANDAFTTMKTSIVGLANEFAVVLGPTITTVFNSATEAVVQWESTSFKSLANVSRALGQFGAARVFEGLSKDALKAVAGEGRGLPEGVPDVGLDGGGGGAEAIAAAIDKSNRMSGAAIAQRSKVGPGDIGGGNPGLASGAIRGSREAARAIARFSSPGGNSVEDQQLDEQEKIEKNTKATADAIQNLANQATPVIFGLNAEMGTVF